MRTQSEQLEEQARRTRARLSETMEALHTRMTTGQVVEQLADYARRGAPAQFLRNLGRDAVENPLPLTLIGVGVAWLILASSRSPRVDVECSRVEANPAGRSPPRLPRSVDGDWPRQGMSG